MSLRVHNTLNAMITVPALLDNEVEPQPFHSRRTLLPLWLIMLFFLFLSFLLFLLSPSTSSNPQRSKVRPTRQSDSILFSFPANQTPGSASPRRRWRKGSVSRRIGEAERSKPSSTRERRS